MRLTLQEGNPSLNGLDEGEIVASRQQNERSWYESFPYTDYISSRKQNKRPTAPYYMAELF